MVLTDCGVCPSLLIASLSSSQFPLCLSLSGPRAPQPFTVITMLQEVGGGAAGTKKGNKKMFRECRGM